MRIWMDWEYDEMEDTEAFGEILRRREVQRPCPGDSGDQGSAEGAWVLHRGV